jgi:D-sedoheptulose 7-phosphate isomerase
VSCRTRSERGIAEAIREFGAAHAARSFIFRPLRADMHGRRAFLDCRQTPAYDSSSVMATVRPRTGSARADIQALFAASARAREVFLKENTDALERAIDLVADTLAGGHKLLLLGNGGSAADAQHLAAELVGRFQRERRPLPAIALTTDTSALTAIANDYGYEEVFARQVRALGAPGDTVLAISTSGRSPSVLRAVEAARSGGLATIGLTGGTGGDLAGMVDVCLRVSASTHSARIQETHILVGHVICELVDRRLFAGTEPA